MIGTLRDMAAVYIADNACSPEDASAFWARLPENVAIALVKAAPKVAGPWITFDGDISYAASRILGVSFPDMNVMRSPDGGFYWEFSTSESEDDFETVEAAQEAADEWLRTRGYLLGSEALP